MEHSLIAAIGMLHAQQKRLKLNSKNTEQNGMDRCREAFEKLPEINAILRGSEFGFNESINQYYHPDHTEHRLNYAFLMGAWVAWQSRQAEVDRLNSMLDERTN